MKNIITPLVSVVIPTYNRVKELECALTSVLSQTYSNWEILVVDNNSNDNTEEMIKKLNDPRIKIHKIHNRGVIAASRNVGVKHSMGKYIAFLDSDDWWLPIKIEESVKYLEKGYDIIYHDLFLVRSYNQRFFFRKTKSRKLLTPIFDDLISKGNALNNSSVVVRGDIFKKINGFSEENKFIAIEDFDGWLRMAKLTNKFKRIPKTLGYYWIGGGNTSGLARTIKVTEAIQSAYVNEILSTNFKNLQYYDYVKGRAYYLLGNKFEAKIYLSNVCVNNNFSVILYFKSKVMLFLLSLKF